MDLNVRAFRVVHAALSESQDSPTTAAQNNSSPKGGLKGGPSRALFISAEGYCGTAIRNRKEGKRGTVEAEYQR